jgi:hypothetical protein
MEPDEHPTCAGAGLNFDSGCGYGAGLHFHKLSSLVAGGFFSTPPNTTHYHPQALVSFFTLNLFSHKLNLFIRELFKIPFETRRQF